MELLWWFLVVNRLIETCHEGAAVQAPFFSLLFSKMAKIRVKCVIVLMLNYLNFLPEVESKSLSSTLVNVSLLLSDCVSLQCDCR